MSWDIGNPTGVSLSGGCGRTWLVTGAGGMLGREAVKLLARVGERVIGLWHAQLDVTDFAAVQRAIAAYKPAVVWNCAAWTDCDQAESNQAEAYLVNVCGPRNLARACASIGALLVHVSTDYVFDGCTRTPYPERGRTSPLNVYGKTKAAGEEVVLATLPNGSYVVRTAWLFGEFGRNFVGTMIRLERERETVDVVYDQEGQPTWTCDLAEKILAIVNGDAQPGVYHATSSGNTSWYGLARQVFELLGADPERVRPVTTADFPRPAIRPSYSVLGHARWHVQGLRPIRHWKLALNEAFPRLVQASLHTSS